MELYVTQIWIRRDCETLAANLNKFICEDECRAYFVAHVREVDGRDRLQGVNNVSRCWHCGYLAFLLTFRSTSALAFSSRRSDCARASNAIWTFSTILFRTGRLGIAIGTAMSLLVAMAGY